MGRSPAPSRSGLLSAAIVAAIAILVAAGCPPAPTPTVDTPFVRPTPTAPGDWRLRFDDEFAGTALDVSKWRPNWLGPNNAAITGPVNTKEISCYDPARVAVVAGTLSLTAATKSCTTVSGVTYPVASGLVESRDHFTFTYGYVEAQVSVDGSQNWPSFWAVGTGAWPTTGEIDVMEELDGELCWHFHFTGGGPGGCTKQAPTGWHTVGADWEPGEISYYYDGVRVGRITAGVTASPMFLVANLGLKTGGVTPAGMRVDWIRVWQH